MAKTPIPQIVRVSEAELRQLFNERYLPLIQKGQINEQIMRGAGRHPSLPLAQVPYCTESQEVRYFDPKTGEELARVHRYVKPDGKLGASGLPDPKRVIVDGVVYRIIKKKNRS